MEIGWKDTSLVRASTVACLCSTSSCVDVPFTNCLEVQESVYKYIACLHGSWGWGNYEASFPLFTLLAAAYIIIQLCNISGPKEKADQWFSNFLATPDSKKYISHCDSVLHIYVYLPIWLKKFYKIRTLSNIIHSIIFNPFVFYIIELSQVGARSMVFKNILLPSVVRNTFYTVTECTHMCMYLHN